MNIEPNGDCWLDKRVLGLIEEREARAAAVKVIIFFRGLFFQTKLSEQLQLR
jgi:hypothetical protein